MEKGFVGGFLEFDFINVGWWFVGVKVEWVCIMVVNYGEYGY